MNILRAVTIGFLLLETANVITLYFFPDSKYANGVGVFKAWEESKKDPGIHRFVQYLVNWVAGTKLIFILLLVVILLTAEANNLPLMGLVMVVSMASFFWRLFPLIRKMDQKQEITPQNYSLHLGWMISVMIGLFLIATAAAVF